MSRFEGQVVIVTGGALGIGGATARKFAKEGAKVLIADFNEEAATKSVELILSKGGIAAFSHTDVSKSEDVENTNDARGDHGCGHSGAQATHKDLKATMVMTT